MVVGVFVFMKGRKPETDSDTEEEALLEVLLEERPVVSLTPTEDGHYLKLIVEKINIQGATSVDYELLYKTKEGITQGVPGTIKLEGQDKFEEDLLLGSESSGKFRYDDGVEEGSMTLRFRNSGGKLVAKFETDFHLQNDTDLVTSPDQIFKYQLSQKSDHYFITMLTVGYPGKSETEVKNGPYGIFSSSEEKSPGIAELGSDKVYYFDGQEWISLEALKPPDVGLFFGSSK